MNKNKHMTLDDRTTIQTELDKGTSFKEIGIILAKDCTTISKEVRKHICRQKTGALCLQFLQRTVKMYFGKIFLPCCSRTERV